MVNDAQQAGDFDLSVIVPVHNAERHLEKLAGTVFGGLAPRAFAAQRAGFAHGARSWEDGRQLAFILCCGRALVSSVRLLVSSNPNPNPKPKPA